MASAINLLTGEYVVSGASPQALYMYRDTFGTKAERDKCREPIHWPNTRPRGEEIAETASGSSGGVDPSASDVDWP
jgi:hypothetical protein